MLLAPCFLLRTLLGKKERSQFARKFRINQGSNLGLLLAGDDKRQKLEFLHGHLELGALGYMVYRNFFILLVMGEGGGAAWQER